MRRRSVRLLVLSLVPAALAAGAGAASAAGGAAPAGIGPGTDARGGPAGVVAATPSVEVMVVGRSRILFDAASRRAGARRVSVGRRRCAVAAGTPLAALMATGLAVRVRDYGSCTGRAADAAGLYVFQVAGDRAGGPNGWVYKVGNRVGSAGAADPGGPFGTGRLRAGTRLLWFWCRGSGGGCQRTLAVSAPRRAAPGGSLRVVVRGYDDNGRGRAISGAVVRLFGARPAPSARVLAAEARTGAGGVATLAVPAASGSYLLSATAPGLVPSFPVRVSVP